MPKFSSVRVGVCEGAKRSELCSPETCEVLFGARRRGSCRWLPWLLSWLFPWPVLSGAAFCVLLSTFLEISLPRRGHLANKQQSQRVHPRTCFTREHQHRGALRGTPGSACPQPELNATELPSSAPGRPKLIELQATRPSPTPTREDIATTPGCGPAGYSGHRAFAHADTHRGTHRHGAGLWT